MEVIKSSAKGKSPGSDGFTTEFYLESWPYLRNHMMAVYQEILQNGHLTMTQKRRVITLIPKPQKDLDLLKNWQPITLLNPDYKFLAKVLANSLKQHLENLITPDRTGFVPGRYIGCNFQRIQNFLYLCKEEKIE